MTESLSFVLVNESTTTDPALGGPLDDATMSTIAAAVEMQLNRDIAPEWGGDYHVRVDLAANVQPTEVAVIIRDSLPEAPGAAGYHDLENGAAVVYIGRDGSNSLTLGTNALSVTISHECGEVAGDRGANVWADDDAGHEYAQELCDGVESMTYMIGGVTVSDWLMRAFFTPGAPGPYSYLQATGHTGGPAGPFQTAAANGGDYQIERNVDENGATQVTAKGSPKNPKRVAHPSSRAYRRGVRLAA
jgi:hypothetical protein